MNQDKNLIKLETLIGLFTIEDGDIKVLLEKRNEEPYKSYWVLPGGFATNYENFDDTAQKIVNERVGFSNVFIEQSKIFSDIERNPNERVVALSYLATVDMVTYKLKKNLNANYELKWFSIDSIPKMAYDHSEILKNLMQQMKKRMSDSAFLNKIFSLEFTLPELQSVYEQINKTKVDRRNFRKKILNSDTVELTGNKMEGLMGRPANLYRFKAEKTIF